MELFLKNNDYKYAVEQIMLMLFPEERPVYPEKPSGALRAELSLGRGSSFETAQCRISGEKGAFSGSARVKIPENTDEIEAERLRQRIVKLSFYRAGIKYIGKKPVWGALSGIRPGKLMSVLLEQGLSDRAAKSRFIKLYEADESRAELCIDTAHASMAAESALEKRDVCLYIGIPFCPTRCAYCSFVSQTVEKSMGLIPPFLKTLEEDIEATSRAVKAAGLRVAAIYFGGGTPTTLSAEQLGALCGSISERFDLSACREYTVEAGRPDTITREKLEVLRAAGVTRLSINPQTMSDKVLEAIGRRHTAEDVRRAMKTAREVGDFSINMDLIAGLPGDDASGFAKTLEEVLSLSPENITIHTLSLKKGSRITLEQTRIPDAEEVGEMLNFALSSLRGAGFAPYYLYRQKFMSGGFENVGWCRPGQENLYNICIMEELRSILAMGGGASTKLVSGTGKIERFFAPKYPKEYIESIDRVCADKEKIVEFYSALSKNEESTASKEEEHEL